MIHTDPADLATEAEIDVRLPLEMMLRALRTETCTLCSSGIARGQPPSCQSAHGTGPRLIVMASGPGRELAVAPVFWDGRSAIGCTDWAHLGLIRPAVLAPDDRCWLTTAESHDCGLWITDGFDHPQARDLLGAAGLVVTWHLPDVWPFVDGDAVRLRPRPLRSAVDGRAASYGRWPAPWLPWLSAWRLVTDPGPSRGGGCWSVPPMNKAFRRAGLSPLDTRAPALAQAIALASFIRRVPFRLVASTADWAPSASWATPAALVVFLKGRAHRFCGDQEVEPLFADGVDTSQLPSFELLRAYAHLRLADQCEADAAGRPW